MANKPRPASGSPLEVDRMTPYLWFLFVLLSTATLFDGFDSGMLSFAAPESRRSLDIDIFVCGSSTPAFAWAYGLPFSSCSSQTALVDAT